MISAIWRRCHGMGRQAEPDQRSVWCVDWCPATMGLPGGHLHWQCRHQTSSACWDFSLPRVSRETCLINHFITFAWYMLGVFVTCSLLLVKSLMLVSWRRSICFSMQDKRKRKFDSCWQSEHGVPGSDEEGGQVPTGHGCAQRPQRAAAVGAAGWPSWQDSKSPWWIPGAWEGFFPQVRACAFNCTGMSVECCS